MFSVFENALDRVVAAFFRCSRATVNCISINQRSYFSRKYDKPAESLIWVSLPQSSSKLLLKMRHFKVRSKFKKNIQFYENID